MRREWEKFLNRCRWSLAGWRDVWATEESLQQWIWANVASGTLALLLDLTTGERALILALGILILAAELMNSALERAVDLVTEEEHPLARRAKDAGSAAVAMTGIAGGVAWIVILLG